MKLELAESINKLVSSKYLSAKSSGSLVFSPTELAIIRSRSGFPFQLRYCPALSKKPGITKSKSDGSEPKSKFNPFENPSEGLLVARLPRDLEATHNLVLNKYPVISRHSILATVDFKKQTDFLEPQDLDVAYSCLRAWEDESTEATPSRLFAFFNSGEHSGASQPHRHLQFLPVEDMIDPGSSETEWDPLIDVMTEPLPDDPNVLGSSSLPFCHYAMKIPKDPGTGDLKRIYRHLYVQANMSVQSWKEDLRLEHKAVQSNSEEALLSYNLAMTTQFMAICPRLKEAAIIPTTTGEGCVAVNGTILGGTLMVKEISEWDALRQGQVMIDDILAEVCLPNLRKSDNSLGTRL